MARPIVSWAVAIALLASLLPLMSATSVAAAETVVMPFPEGKAIRVIQGYNGGTHRGRSRYGLDFALVGGSTAGAEVVSPIDGAVVWSQGPGAGNGCMAIAFRDGSYSITLCHVLFHRAYGRGESIARGQSLGTVGAAGRVGNAGTPHVHMELHRGGRSDSPVPFSPPEGLALEGVALAASGAYGEHGGRELIASTNRVGGGVILASSTLAGEVEQVAAAAAAAQDRRDQPPSSATAPTSARAAVVRGTESCLNVREGPSTRALLLGCLPEGSAVTVVEGPTAGDGFEWYRIERARPSQQGGWAVGRYLE